MNWTKIIKYLRETEYFNENSSTIVEDKILVMENPELFYITFILTKNYIEVTFGIYEDNKKIAARRIYPQINFPIEKIGEDIKKMETEIKRRRINEKNT